MNLSVASSSTSPCRSSPTPVRRLASEGRICATFAFGPDRARDGVGRAVRAAAIAIESQGGRASIASGRGASTRPWIPRTSASASACLTMLRIVASRSSRTSTRTPTGRSRTWTRVAVTVTVPRPSGVPTEDSRSPRHARGDGEPAGIRSQDTRIKSPRVSRTQGPLWRLHVHAARGAHPWTPPRDSECHRRGCQRGCQFAPIGIGELTPRSPPLLAPRSGPRPLPAAA